jgi:hypothetical protein
MSGRRLVVDEAWVDELVRGIEVALLEELPEHAAGDLLVVRERHGSSLE